MFEFSDIHNNSEGLSKENKDAYNKLATLARLITYTAEHVLKSENSLLLGKLDTQVVKEIIAERLIYKFLRHFRNAEVEINIHNDKIEDSLLQYIKELSCNKKISFTIGNNSEIINFLDGCVDREITTTEGYEPIRSGSNVNTVSSKEIAKNVGNVLLSELSVYKNAGKAQIDSLTGYIKERFANDRDCIRLNTNHASLFRIEEVELPKLAKDNDKLKIFTTAINLTALNDYYKIPDVVSVDLDTEIKVTDKSLNSYIKEYITKDVMENSKEYLYYLTNSIRIEDTPFLIKDLIISYILGTHILENQIKQTGISPIVMRDMLLKIETYILYGINIIKKRTADGLLFLKYENKNNEPIVYVNKEVFDSIDGEDNIVEAIFGLAVKRDTLPIEKTKASILTNKIKLSNLWKEYTLLTSAVNPIDKINCIHRVIKHSTTKLLEQLERNKEESLKYCSNKDNYGGMKKALDAILSTKKPSFEDDYVYDVAVEFVCGTLFDLTNFKQYMDLSLAHMKETKNTEQETILSLVITDMLIDFYINHIHVE